MITLTKILKIVKRCKLNELYLCQSNQKSPQKHSLTRQSWFFFSKKQEAKKKRTQDPRERPKTQADYLYSPENLKQNILEVRNMQTASEANLEEESIKKIVVNQRQLLQQSLQKQIEGQLEKKPQQSQKGLKFSKLLRGTVPQSQAGKYYLLRPLIYLQNLYMAIFGANILGYTWLELTQSFANLGWFFGLFTSPSACSTIPLLLGYNLGFWIVRQSFYLNLPSQDLSKTSISLIQTSWKEIFELTFIATQFAAFIYVLTFPLNFPVYKAYIVISALNFGSLFLNILSVSKAASISSRVYIFAYAKLVSTISIVILLFAVYEIQITAGKTPEQSFDSKSYKERIVSMMKGYEQFKSVFKKKKIMIKEEERINLNQE